MKRNRSPSRMPLTICHSASVCLAIVPVPRSVRGMFAAALAVNISQLLRLRLKRISSGDELPLYPFADLYLLAAWIETQMDGCCNRRPVSRVFPLGNISICTVVGAYP